MAYREYLPVNKRKMYAAWAHAKQRCTNPNDARYKTYGGRGIKMCRKWAEDFNSFYEDMGSTWKLGLTLDRIDNDKNYSPDNCRWATNYEQSMNRTSNRWLEFNGVKKRLCEWSDEFGIKRTTISQRIDAYGWTVERALTVSKRISN